MADSVFKVETVMSEASLLSLAVGTNEVRVTAVKTRGESIQSAPVICVVPIQRRNRECPD